MNKQELTEKLEDLQNQINEVREKINNLNDYDFKPTPKGWKPDYDENYFFADCIFKPICYTNENTDSDKGIIKYNRIFKTKEECQLYCDIQRAFRDTSREFISGEDNYCICYDYRFKEIDITYHQNIIFCGMLYFDSEETIQNLIDKFGEENVKRYYLGVY